MTRPPKHNIPMSGSSHSDQGAAFKGLLVTTALLFVTVFAIVKWTNAKFAGHNAAAPAAAEKH